MDLLEAKHFYDSQGSRRHPWELARLEIIWTLIGKYRDIGKKESKLLDFGCGDGFVLKAFAARFPKIQLAGVDSELDQVRIERFRREDPPIGLYRSLEELAGDKGVFDVVLLCDVLEHIEQDAQTLKDLAQRSFTGADTLFLITVPAFQAVFSAHDKWLGHYRRYDQRSLSRTIAEAGLKRIESGYFFSSLLCVRTLISLIEKVFPPKKQKGLAGWKGGEVLTKLYYAALITDFKIGAFLKRLGIDLPGLSCYALCQRQGQDLEK